jgi:serine/threonine protein kinase
MTPGPQMPLAPGTRLGPYEVVAPLGAGGMGEVYRAHDSSLKRDVALKVLPDAFAADPERLAWFEREAHVLAALNHPYIAAIHGLAHDGPNRALVLELVEGATLADRIAVGPIAVDEALPVAQQIAEALEPAHDQGIVHRDVKPANVKVTADRGEGAGCRAREGASAPAPTGNVEAGRRTDVAKSGYLCHGTEGQGGVPPRTAGTDAGGRDSAAAADAPAALIDQPREVWP